MKTTTIGVVAACSASSVTAVTGSRSSIPTAIVSRSGGVYNQHHNRKQQTTENVVNSIRGGNAPASSSTTAEKTTTTSVEEEDELDTKDIAKENAEKKRRKKKKYKKKQTNNKKSSASSSQQSTRKKQQSINTPEKEDSTDQSSTSESSTKTNNNNNKSSKSPLSPEAQSILNQTCHYNILGITKSATQSQIQKAYRKRCIITHPDKVSGDRSAFDKVSVAYDILSCEKKRAVYDKFGQKGLDEGLDVHSDGVRGFGMGMGNGNFGTDVFRDFFSGTGIDPFNFAGRRHQQQQQQSSRRNRDLRYQLEVTLEELYNGTTKHVLIQQPNGSSYYQHHRKEVEVTLPKGMSNGQSVRLSGVVDSIKDAPPADVIFIIRERRHPIFTRRGNDLAIEVSITYAESIVGYKRTLKCLNGKEIVICNPVVAEVVKVDELIDAPSLPKLQKEGEEFVATIVNDDDSVVISNNSTNSTAVISNNATAATANTTIEQVETPPEQITKTTTTSYKLPPSIIQTGDVHVLKGYGMPIKGYQGHDSDEYGNLYIQYRVESPLSSTSSSSTTKTSNLSPQERVDLARLLNKLEGNTDDIAKDIVVSSDETITQDKDDQKSVHHLVISSVSEFGRTTDSSVNNHGDDEHLRHDEDYDVNMPHGFRSTEDVSDFVHRAFAGRTGPFGGTSFGFSTFTSSSGGGGGGGGGGYGYNGHGEEEDHKVECNQM